MKDGKDVFATFMAEVAFAIFVLSLIFGWLA